MSVKPNDELFLKAKKLNLYGILANWEEIKNETWLPKLLVWEETEKLDRGLKLRVKNAKLGQFKQLAHFDWSWPKKCDRALIEELMHLKFMQDAMNLIFCGQNGVGKSTISRNIAYQAVIQGHTAIFITAGEMLNDLASQDGDMALRRRIRYYSKPDLLVIDEVGYLSYSNRHADLLFEIVSRRYQNKSIIITTNRPFSEWNDIFSNAACVVSMIDRLVHHSEIIQIDANSYRLKESKEKTNQRKKIRDKKIKEGE